MHYQSNLGDKIQGVLYKDGSPGRVVKAHGTDNVIKAMFETQPVTLKPKESTDFLSLKQQINKKRCDGKPSRLWSAVARTDPFKPGEVLLSSRFGGKNKAAGTNHSNHRFQLTTTSQGNFNLNGSQVRNSFDKVISYDTTSLVDGIGGEKENDKNSRNKGKTSTAVAIPKLKQRPITSGTVTARSGAPRSLNEQFNQKLIEHGTANGVPPSELPDPSTVFSSLQGLPPKQKVPAYRLKKVTTMYISEPKMRFKVDQQ